MEMISAAPKISDCLCEECQTHFAKVLELLSQAGVEPVLNPRLVRGLDYYNRTTFEVVSGEIGAQSAVAGGGRYDGLVELLGGPSVPGIGFACGMERLALLLPEREAKALDFYCLVLDAEGFKQAFALVEELRAKGLCGVMNYQLTSFKSAMRQADKSRARYCLLLGSEERAKNCVTLKSMLDGTQSTVALDNLAEIMLKKES
ncbi:MAG: histidine--tRNA ligase [Desulfovibrio sp.]|nr:histidine--tRNA ligase [Desulfovibrio sp.]